MRVTFSLDLLLFSVSSASRPTLLCLPIQA
jgi:hypothetical protein